MAAVWNLLLISAIWWMEMEVSLGAFPYDGDGLGLTRIPESIADDVTQVFLFNNEITTLVNHNLPEGLEDLYIYGNKITEVPSNVFATLTKLKDLDLQRNQLTSDSISPHAFKENPIETLSLNFNNLGSVPDLDAIKDTLVHLYMSQTGIQVLPDYAFVKYGHLEYLHLTSNHMTSIGRHAFRGVGKKCTINLGDNDLTVFPDMSYTEIEELGLIGNEISTIPPSTMKSFSADKLDLRRNKLKSFPDPRETSSSIGFLDLRSNPLNCDCNVAWVKDAQVFGWMNVNVTARPCREPAWLVGKCWTDIQTSDLVCGGPVPSGPRPTWTPETQQCKPQPFKFKPSPEIGETPGNQSSANTIGGDSGVFMTLSSLVVGIAFFYGNMRAN